MKVLGTELDVAHRVTLVHELTHAWQDQQGYLDELDDLDDGQAYTLQALAEGDATRIENAYVDSLSNSELDDYDRQSAQQGERRRPRRRARRARGLVRQPVRRR